jgi:hypothetical protein
MAGCGMVTRPTALFYAATVPLVVCLSIPRERRSWTPLLGYLAAAAVLPTLYLVTRRVESGQALPYLAAWHRMRDNAAPPERFLDSLTKVMRLPLVASESELVNSTIVATQILYYAILFPALRGYCGPRARTATWGMIAFMVAHSFWDYDSERFNFLALPLAAFMMARGTEWLVDRRLDADRTTAARAVIFAMLIAVVCSGQVLYARTAIDDHIKALRVNTGRPHDLARLANRDPGGTAWIEIGPEFAYFYDGKTYFDKDEPFFFRRTAGNTAQFFARENVRWVVTRETAPGWLMKHPDLTSATVTLSREASDGLWTLYRAEPKQ